MTEIKINYQSMLCIMTLEVTIVQYHKNQQDPERNQHQVKEIIQTSNLYMTKMN